MTDGLKDHFTSAYHIAITNPYSNNLSRRCSLLSKPYVRNNRPHSKIYNAICLQQAVPAERMCESSHPTHSLRSAEAQIAVAPFSIDNY